MSSTRQGHTLKPHAAKARATTNEKKSAEGYPGQEGPRHTEKRDSQYRTRSHKSIRRLTGSQNRMDSREQIYDLCDAWGGQSHE